MKMNILLMPGTVLGALLALPGWTHATAYECSLGSEQRRISLDYPGQNHLCEVSVTRNPSAPDANREVKWYADNSSGFCSVKFDELVDKYQTMWAFNCQDISGNTASNRLGSSGLELLSDRHRVLLDSIVKRTIEEGRNGENPFEIDAIQALTAPLDNQTSSAIVVQMFMKNADQQNLSGSDRTYYVIDDGSRYKTSAVAVSLGSKITPLEAGYRVASASIASLLPSGLVEVRTKVFAPDDDGDVPSCEGSQQFSALNGGRFNPALPHEYVCKQ